METLNEYISTHSGKRPGQDIEQRWQERVVRQGMKGKEGAERYLEAYGRNISAAKVCLLAIRAQQDQDMPMSVAFWQAAYEIETGHLPPVEQQQARVPEVTQASPAPVAAKAPAPEEVVGLPKHLQPGKVVTMQPTDAINERDYYINSPDYFGQPKYDGNRMMVFAGSDGTVAYQMRTMAVRAPQNVAIHQALSDYAKQNGALVLDGEWWWEDCNGGEHRTAAQTVVTNIELGKPEVRPVPRYSVFAILHWRGDDLTRGTATSRANMGHAVAERLHQLCPGILPVETAYAVADKRALAARQLAEGREGEVWYYNYAPYTGGKTPGENIVRTKYTVEFDAVVTNLLPSDKANRPFSAIEVALYDPATWALKSIGSVGTGFTQDDMTLIANSFAKKSPNDLTIKVQSRRFTEFGKVWHASYEGISPRPAKECRLDQIQ